MSLLVGVGKGGCFVGSEIGEEWYVVLVVGGECVF